jgi:hypothetical protein
MKKLVFTILILIFNFWNCFEQDKSDAKDMVLGGLHYTETWKEKFDDYDQAKARGIIYKYQTGKRGKKCNSN